MSLGLRIAGFDIDLFKEENVILNAVTKDLKDPSKVFSDYSQQFTVPASKNNNRVFQHCYSVDIDHRLDIRKTVEAEITVNTRFFRKGRVVILGVNMKGNKPDSYKIQFIGELSSLSGALGESNIRDLDLSDSSFSYDRSNIALRFTQFYGNGDIIFTLLSSKLRYYWDSGQTVPERDDYKNLAKGLNYLDLSPSVSIRYLFNKIATKNNLKFNISTEFDSILNGLYLFCDINKEDDSRDNIIQMSWMPPDGTSINDVFEVVHYGRYGLKNNRITINMTINDQAKDYDYRVYAIDQDTKEVILPRTGEELKKGNFDFIFNRNNWKGSLIFYVISKYPMSYTTVCSVFEYASVNQFSYVIGRFGYSDMRDYDVTAYLPAITQTDFVSSLVKMFNLVIIPDGDTYSFMTYSEWRERGVIWNLSDFVDVGDYTINREELPKMFDFTFNENDSFLMDEFRKRFNRDYGNLKYNVEEKNIYTSDTKEIEVVFDNAIFERVSDQENGNKTTIQTGFLESDQKLIHYAVVVPLEQYQIDMGGDPAYPWIVTQSLIPSHTQNIWNMWNNTVFGEEIEEYTNIKIQQSLFKRHYADEIKKMFNKNTRKINLPAIVSSNILLNIENNDKIDINGNIYEIDKMQINLSTNKIDFELSFYDKRI